MLIKNIKYSFLQNFLSLILGFVISIYVARILRPDKLGEYSYYLWLVSFLNTFIILSLPGTISKYISQWYPNKIENIKFLFKKFGIFHNILCILVSLSIIIFSILFPTKIKYAGLLILLTVLFYTNTILSSIATGLQKFNILMISNLTSLICQFVLIFSILKKFPYPSVMIKIYIFSYLFSFFILTISNFNFFIELKKIKYLTGEKEIFSKVFSFYKFSVIILILDYIVWQNSEIFFLKLFSSLKEISFYTISFTLAYYPPKIIGSAIGRVAMPYMSSVYGYKEYQKLNLSYNQFTNILSFLLIPIYVFMFFFAKQIIYALYGEEYIYSYKVMIFLLFSGLVGGISSIGSSYIYAIEKPDIIVNIGIKVSIINIVLNLLLIPSYGSVGAAIGNSFSQILACIMGTGYIIKNFKLEFPFLDIVKYLLFSIFLSLISKFFVASYINNKFYLILFAVFYYSVYLFIFLIIFNQQKNLKSLISGLK